MPLLKRKKKKVTAEHRWLPYAYVDTPAQRDRIIRRLKKDGFETRWAKVLSGRHEGGFVIQSRIPA